MVTHVTEISTPPTPADPPTEFEQKAAKVWSELHQAIPQMNQQADDIEQIGVDAQAAAGLAVQEAEAAIGYRNETRAARDAALPAAVTATDMAAQAVTAKEQTEEARDEAQAAAASAVNRVAKTSDAGAALLPEGNDAQRPTTGSIPAGALVMRGNSQAVGDYIAEYWDRGAAAWRSFASRAWVKVITDALAIRLTALEALNRLTGTGSAPYYGCRAWVSFNGSGTVAIRGSGNVTSITDHGVGFYTVNFAELMIDANYSAVVTCNNVSTAGPIAFIDGTSVSQSGVAIRTGSSGGAAIDMTIINLTVVR